MKRLFKYIVRKKHKGLTGSTTTMMFIIFLVIVMSFIFTMYSYRAVNTNLRDAVTDANLAAGTIALRNYGKTHEIVICTPEVGTSEYYELDGNSTDSIRYYTAKNFELFKKSLAFSLKAGSGPNGLNVDSITSTTTLDRDDYTYNGITVEMFRIYNFRQDYTGYTPEGYIDPTSLRKWVDVITYNNDGSTVSYQRLEDSDPTVWPTVTYVNVKGETITVTDTSIYSIVIVPVRGNFSVYDDQSWSTYGESAHSARLDQLTQIKPGGGFIVTP